MTFAHVSVRTSDIDRSFRFYEGHFGMKLERFEQAGYENRVFDHLAFVIQDMEGTLIELIERK